MSHAYSTEPPTRGKVVLNTSGGEIEIELWPKEAPKACRNFVQLCMEGYYDNNIFHRIVRGFIIQSGDPTGTGFGGESVYGAPFQDEFHSRIRFSHRGLLAMANTGPNTNKSQFFFTLDKTEHLNRQNTIFGKIVGNTIFNLMRLGELDTDKDDRPIYPPKILGASVLSNPFEDIVPRALTRGDNSASGKDSDATDKQKPVAATKKSKNLSLLSFDEKEEEPIVFKQKIKSMHDVVLDDPRLSQGVAAEPEPVAMDESKDKSNRRRRDDSDDSDTDDESEKEPVTSKDHRYSRDAQKTAVSSKDSQIRELRNEIRAINKPTAETPSSVVSKPPPKDVPSVADLRNAYLSSGRAVSGNVPRSKKSSTKRSDPRDDPVLAKLHDFQRMLRTASSVTTTTTSDTKPTPDSTSLTDDINPDEQECELHFITGCESCRDAFGSTDADTDLDLGKNDTSWMTATLKFKKQVGANVYEPKVEDYAVIDPRQEFKTNTSQHGNKDHRKTDSRDSSYRRRTDHTDRRDRDTYKRSRYD